jgi:ribonuclease HII
MVQSVVGIARYERPERKLGMSDSEELASKERRRRLIERLNEKEKLLGPQSSASRGAQMSEEELATEIEKERQRNLSRQGFPFGGMGG